LGALSSISSGHPTKYK